MKKHISIQLLFNNSIVLPIGAKLKKFIYTHTYVSIFWVLGWNFQVSLHSFQKLMGNQKISLHIIIGYFKIQNFLLTKFPRKVSINIFFSTNIDKMFHEPTQPCSYNDFNELSFTFFLPVTKNTGSIDGSPKIWTNLRTMRTTLISAN